MKNIATLLVAVSVLVGFATAEAALGQRDFSQVEMQTQHVAGAVHMLVGAGGNIGVSAGDDGVLIVDDQFAPLVPKIRQALGQISPGKLEFVLNTHFHGDHTGGNAALGQDALIVAHDNVRRRLSTEQRRGERTQPAQPAEALPVVTFADALSIHFNGEEIRVQHFPTSHTDGDAVVHFVGSNVVHLGDLFFAGRFPFVDVESGGNALGLLQSIKHLEDWMPAGAKIIPGHGPLSTSDDLASYRRMLESTIDTVRKARESGKSLEQVQEAGFAEEWANWGSGFINSNVWAQIVYASLEEGD